MPVVNKDSPAVEAPFNKALSRRTRSAMLVDALEALEEDGVRWCLLHSPEDYPHNIMTDVDIIVEPAAFRRIPRLIQERTGLTIVQFRVYEATSIRYDLVTKGEDERPVYLGLDVSSDFRDLGRSFIGAEEFLRGRKLYSPSLWSAPADLEFISHLLKRFCKSKMIGADALTLQHGSELTRLYLQAPNRCEEHLRRFFPPKQVRMITHAARSEAWHGVRGNLGKFRRSMLFKTARGGIMRAAKCRWQDTQRRLFRIRQPAGVTVALLGPDGSGKTSVLSRLENNMKETFQLVRRYHLRPHWERSCKSGRPFTNPHGKPPRGALTSVLKMAVWVGDYILTYAVYLLPLLSRSTLILFDRYFDDLLVDPRRYRYGGPKWLPLLLRLVIPRPDLFIVLDAPAEVLHARKPEVVMQESARQRGAYRTLVGSMPNGHVVDATPDLDQVTLSVERIVLDYMRRRSARRLTVCRGWDMGSS